MSLQSGNLFAYFEVYLLIALVVSPLVRFQYHIRLVDYALDVKRTSPTVYGTVQRNVIRLAKTYPIVVYSLLMLILVAGLVSIRSLVAPAAHLSPDVLVHHPLNLTILAMSAALLLLIDMRNLLNDQPDSARVHKKHRLLGEFLLQPFWPKSFRRTVVRKIDKAVEEKLRPILLQKIEVWSLQLVARILVALTLWYSWLQLHVGTPGATFTLPFMILAFLIVLIGMWHLAQHSDTRSPSTLPRETPTVRSQQPTERGLRRGIPGYVRIDGKVKAVWAFWAIVIGLLFIFPFVILAYWAISARQLAHSRQIEFEQLTNKRPWGMTGHFTMGVDWLILHLALTFLTFGFWSVLWIHHALLIRDARVHNLWLSANSRHSLPHRLFRRKKQGSMIR